MLGRQNFGNFDQESYVPASVVFSVLTSVASAFGVAQKNLDGGYEKVNWGFEALFGRQSGAITGRTDKDLFATDIVKRLKRSDQQIRDGHSIVREEICIPLAHGLTRTQWIKLPIVRADGSLLAIGIFVMEANAQGEIEGMRHALVQLSAANHQLQQELVEFERQASTDKLTGAWNRRRFEDAVISERERFIRYGHPLSLIIIDVDFFKNVNDQYGHATGDKVLAIVAQAIQSTLRVTDSLTRWGGDEFVVLSPETNLPAMVFLAERLREKICSAVFPDVKSTTISIGVAQCLRDETWETWFHRADQALYRAKACGRNQVQCSCEVPSDASTGISTPKGFTDLVWHPAYECGHRFLDNQHRALFLSVNALLLAIFDGHPSEEIEALAERLINEAAQHFNDEESILADAGFSGLSEHALEHARLIECSRQIANQLHAGSAHVGELFLFLAHDVVTKHMLTDDRVFFPLIESLRPDVNAVF